MNGELLGLASALYEAHHPYVLATVVWARGPSSSKQGSTAIIEADGAIHGWIGGACAEPAVLREARRALSEGTARLMYLGPAEELDGHRRDGVVTVPIACGSEGALEVFMEPVVPKPHIVMIGSSPALDTLARLVDAVGWRSSVVDDAADRSPHRESRPVHGLDAVKELARDAAAVVVATQGHYDEPAVTAALATEVPYVGLVASRKRSEAVLGYLADQGMSDDDLERIKTPAGLDLGPVEHREIAVAILAELVAMRAAGTLERSGSRAEAPAEATDPVCGMTVAIATARWSSVVEGTSHYFCSAACKSAFDAEPAGLGVPPPEVASS